MSNSIHTDAMFGQRLLSFGLILYLSLLTPGSGMVLCWGDAGHLSLEVDHTESCCSHYSPSTENPDLANEAASDCECGFCVDIPLSVDSDCQPVVGSSQTNPGKILSTLSVSNESPRLSLSAAASLRTSKTVLTQSHFHFVLASLHSVQLTI